MKRLLVCLVAALSCPVTALADDPARPNVLFVAIDDLNDWVGPLGGHPLVKTPHMDALAARGTTFTNAHCQSPLCNPSRTSLLTGLRPSTTGVYALKVWFREDERLRDHATLPQHFMRHGYHVATTGKIFHDAYPPPQGREPNTEFTEWGLKGGFTTRPPKKFVNTPDDIALMDWGVFPENDEDCFDYDVATFASDWLRKSPRDKPWMLCVGIRHPHVPCYAPQQWFDLYPDDESLLPPMRDGDRDDVPPFAWHLHWKLPEPRLAWLKASDQWRPLVRAYLASVSFADAMLGRVLESLEQAEQAENTIVVLWSDHGWHLGEKDVSGKNTLWDRSTRVPLIVAGPGIAKDAHCARPAELL
nr:sulfatase [Planctomycetaceae bacterium]